MKGKCYICEETYTKRGMTRHVKSCFEKNYTNNVQTGDKKKLYYYIYIEGQYRDQYWLHLQVAADSNLSVLDDFLRTIWLECCGHLSAFTINGQHFSIKPMYDLEEYDMRDYSLKELLTPETKFSYEYDFGSSTDLKLRVVDLFKAPEREAPVSILARNEKPVIPCSYCGEPAVMVCPECLYQNKGWLCEECAEEHGEVDCNMEVDMLLPVVNSPRTGICAYSGDSESMQQFL